MPERVIFECFKTLIENSADPLEEDKHEMNIKFMDSGGRRLVDSIYPDWPSLLVGRHRVQKNNILIFLKKISTLNDKFKSV